ncbi:hypothetical protein K431DRAFT_294383 [Polychaeton citri CBS 116435]|uniref:Apple domain-containing protein n=1 Tax=Polychaeton citri CBS 116435 TaxID=1314669 RepID=A0A9P4Q8C1_9PEZI|nr:hypothetical protein K431DRAFT_294383 [Polychaeton citri CBS 116435]
MVSAFLPVLTLIYSGLVLGETDNVADLDLVGAASPSSSSLTIEEPSSHGSLSAGIRYCDIHNITCPYCNNALTYAAGSEYEVECDVARTCSSDTSPRNVIRNGPDSSANISISICLDICEADRPDCKGGSYSKEGCDLCLGDNILYETRAGYTGFIPATVSMLVQPAPPRATAPISSVPNAISVPHLVPNATIPFGSAGFGTYAEILPPTAAASGVNFAPYRLSNATLALGSSYPDTTSRPHVPLGPGSGGARCSPNDLQCPLCKDVTVTDSRRIPYEIRCDSYLFSNRTYTYPGRFNSNDCLELCDLNATCTGGYLAPGKRCTLAFDIDGNFSFLIQPDYISFIAANKGFRNITTASAPFIGTEINPVNSISHQSIHLPTVVTQNLTATVQPIGPMHLTPYGGASSSETKQTVTKILTATVQPIPESYSHVSFTYQPSATPSLTPEEFCDPSDMNCPACDGLIIQDAFNQSYRVQCNYRPTCQQLVGYYGRLPIDVCLHNCDVTPLCFAAIFSNGHCDLCEGNMEGAYGRQNNYTVFIPANGTASMTIPGSTSLLPSTIISSMSFKLPMTTITDSFVTTNSRPRSTLSTSSSLSSSSPSSSPSNAFPTTLSNSSLAVTCPGSDNELVLDPSDTRHYQVQCDTLYGAARRRHTIANDFQSCAASCKEECNGFLFGFGRNCILLTGVSAVASVTGWTAGVQVVRSTAASASPLITPIFT